MLAVDADFFFGFKHGDKRISCGMCPGVDFGMYGPGPRFVKSKQTNRQTDNPQPCYLFHCCFTVERLVRCKLFAIRDTVADHSEIRYLGLSGTFE